MKIEFMKGVHIMSVQVKTSSTEMTRIAGASVVESSAESGNNNAISSGAVYTIKEQINANTADKYDSTATYAVDDYCIYNDVLYKCTTAITTAESFDSTKWSATDIGTELSTVNSDLSDQSVKSATLTITTSANGEAIIMPQSDGLLLFVSNETSGVVPKFEIFTANGYYYARATYYSTTTYSIIANTTIDITYYYI